MIRLKNFKKAKFIIPVLLILAIAFYSCSNEYVEESEMQNNTEYEFDNTNPKISCDMNLTNDGCEFTSGEGKVAGSYNTMVNLLDNCHTETLASNCNWYKYKIKEKYLTYNFIITHCNSAEIMNNILDNIENDAKSNRPNSSYIIIGYELVYGTVIHLGSNSSYFKLKIRVKYRKKICSLSGNPQLPQLP